MQSPVANSDVASGYRSPPLLMVVTFSFFRPISLPPPLAAPASRLTHKKKKQRTATPQWPNQPVWTCGSRPPPPAEEACYRPVTPSAATSILRLAVPFFSAYYPAPILSRPSKYRSTSGIVRAYSCPKRQGFFFERFPHTFSLLGFQTFVKFVLLSWHTHWPVLFHRHGTTAS